jgi:hypothetical protein
MDPGKLGSFLPDVWTSSSRIHIYYTDYAEVSEANFSFGKILKANHFINSGWRNLSAVSAIQS